VNPVHFLQDLTVVLSVAAAVLLVFRRLGQPPVLGYLAAGLLIGPHTAPGSLIADVHSLEALAEIGVVFLLFSLGIEYNFRRLARSGARALFCAALEAALMIALGTAASRGLGWSLSDGLLLGGVVAVSATSIAGRALLERARRPSGWEELAAGKLIAEDIVAVLLIAFFSSAARLGRFDAAAIGSTLLRFGSLLTVLLLTGLIALPRLLRLVDSARMEEVRSLAVVGICFAVSLLTLKLGYSAALGAFLAGAISSVGGTTGKLHDIAAPFKDVFGAVFFVSVGMLIDPAWIVAHWLGCLGLTLAVVAARGAVNFLAFAAAGEEAVAAAQAAIVMLPIGEFSFILAQLAQREGLSARPLYPLAVVLCLGTTAASGQLLVLASEERLRGAAPRGLVAALDAYRRRLQSLRVPARAAQAWTLIRPSAIQIALNLVGISGLFLAVDAAREPLAALDVFPGALWCAAALVSLPFLNALLRKTQAVTLILLEAAEGGVPAERNPGLTRLVLSFAAFLVAWWYLSISLFLLPPWPYSALPVLLVGVAVLALWRRTSRLYAALQAALRDSLSRGQPRPEAAAAAWSVLMDSLAPEAISIVPVRLGASDWGASATLGDLELRERTGASLLQVNRKGAPMPFLSPDRALAEGDELLLIGEREQIRKAEALLRAGPSIVQ
jgi:CPA2 family monovalent cation:H+ antiporter-2